MISQNGIITIWTECCCGKLAKVPGSASKYVMYPVEWFHHTRSELIITPLLNCSHGTLVIPHSPVPPMPPKLPSTMHCSQLCPLLPNTIPAFAPLYWLNINLASVAQVEWCTWCILVHTLLHSPVYLGAFWCMVVHSGVWWVHSGGAATPCCAHYSPVQHATPLASSQCKF